MEWKNLQEYLKAFKKSEEYIAKRFPKLAMYVRYSTYFYEISMCRQLLETLPEEANEVLKEVHHDLARDRQKILKYFF